MTALVLGMAAVATIVIVAAAPLLIGLRARQPRDQMHTDRDEARAIARYRRSR